MTKMIERVASIGGIMISDLHYEEHYKTIHKVLESIKEEYTLEEWNEFIRYANHNQALWYESKEDILCLYEKDK